MRYLILALALVGCGVAQAEEPSDMTTKNRQALDSGETSWSQSGTLITGNTQAGVPLTKIFGEPGTYTVAFRLGRLAGTPSQPTARANITWTVHGVQLRRVVTVVDGTSLSAPADSVNVTLLDSSSPGIGAGAEYPGTITAAKGVRGNSKQPPWLYLGSLNVSPGANGLIQVEQDVGALSLYVRAANLTVPTAIIPRGTVGILQGGVGALASGVYDPRDYDWVPIVPGINTIQCFADAALLGDIKFEAYLGIDG